MASRLIDIYIYICIYIIMHIYYIIYIIFDKVIFNCLDEEGLLTEMQFQ